MALKEYSVQIGPRAARHLTNIADYIGQDSPWDAARFVDELTHAILSLKHFPLRCPLAPEGTLRGEQLRHLVHGNYRVLFTVRGLVVRVHGVRHAMRRPSR
jgi:plasmid stabilization system protein ParE